MWYRIFHITKKEFIQTLRDRRAFVIIMVAPIFQLLIFGYVATTDIKMSSAVICDYDGTSKSREFIRKFSASGYFNDKYYTTSTKEFDHYIDSGKAVIGITIPPGFQKMLLKGKQATVGLILDGTNSNLATILSGYLQFITADYSQQISGEYFSRKGLVLKKPIDVEPRIWFNPDHSQGKGTGNSRTACSYPDKSFRIGIGQNNPGWFCGILSNNIGFSSWPGLV